MNNWCNELKDYNYKVLITLGFFTKKALGYVLKNSKLKGTTLLVQAGLKDYMDTNIKVTYLPTNNNIVNSLVLSAIEEYLNMKATPFTCSYCTNPLITVCNYCGALLCKRHFIICPVCRNTFCHPDTGRECFYKHKC